MRYNDYQAKSAENINFQLEMIIEPKININSKFPARSKLIKQNTIENNNFYEGAIMIKHKTTECGSGVTRLQFQSGMPESPLFKYT